MFLFRVIRDPRHFFTFSFSQTQLYMKSPNLADMGSEEVLLLFGVFFFLNPRWLSWPLIGQDIFLLFFSEKNCIKTLQKYSSVDL